MKSIRKIKLYLLLICFLINIVYVTPSYSLSPQEDLFKNALNLSSSGEFNLALKQWNKYLELFPNDAAALSNRGNIKLVNGDPKGAIEDQDKAIELSFKKLMDICLLNIDNNSNKSLNPTSVIGMLWLQTHFEDTQWEALSNNQVIISKENSKLLVKDAISAGLKIKSFSGVSMLDVFQKKN